MNPDLPHHLHATRDLLMGSMRTHASEQAPAIPSGLLEDLTHSSVVQPAEFRQNHVANLFESLRALIASPAFGASAAAVMVLAVASTVILRPDADTNSQVIRGASDYSAADSARIFLVSAPLGLQSELEDVSDFEDGAILSVANAESTTELKGGRIVVDFTSGLIKAINAKGENVYQSDIPESTSGLSLEIASALIRL